MLDEILLQLSVRVQAGGAGLGTRVKGGGGPEGLRVQVLGPASSPALGPASSPALCPAGLSARGRDARRI